MRATPIVPGDPWTALGCDTRRQVLARVTRHPCSVAEIAADLPVSRPAVSQHLRVLADANLVRCRTAGRRRIYSARPDGLERLRAELETFWSQTLTDFKQLVEHDATEATPR